MPCRCAGGWVVCVQKINRSEVWNYFQPSLGTVGWSWVEEFNKHDFAWNFFWSLFESTPTHPPKKTTPFFLFLESSPGFFGQCHVEIIQRFKAVPIGASTNNNEKKIGGRRPRMSWRGNGTRWTFMKSFWGGRKTPAYGNQGFYFWMDEMMRRYIYIYTYVYLYIYYIETKNRRECVQTYHVIYAV